MSYRLIGLIILTALPPAYGLQASASQVTLTYQAHKKILHLGEMVMNFTALPDKKYHLSMTINGNRILKNRTETLSSSGVLDERLNLIAEEFIDKKYRILFDNGRVAEIYRNDVLQPAFDSANTANLNLNLNPHPILDPVSAIWQIIPQLGEKPCNDTIIHYFNGKHMYQLRLSDAQPLKLSKKHQKLHASHATSCMMHRVKNGAKNGEAAETSKLLLLEATHYPHPLIYQFYGKDAVRFTLHAIDIVP